MECMTDQVLNDYDKRCLARIVCSNNKQYWLKSHPHLMYEVPGAYPYLLFLCAPFNTMTLDTAPHLGL